MSEAILSEGSAAQPVAQTKSAPVVNQRALRVPKPLVGIRPNILTRKVTDPTLTDGDVKMEYAMQITDAYGKKHYHTAEHRVRVGVNATLMDIYLKANALFPQDTTDGLAILFEAAGKVPPPVTKPVTQLQAPGGLAAATLANLTKPLVLDEPRARQSEIIPNTP